MSRTFAARYPGRCAACDDPIEVGDLLTYDEDNEVVHANGCDQPRRPERPTKVCPICNLAMPLTGVCCE